MRSKPSDSFSSSHESIARLTSLRSPAETRWFDPHMAEAMKEENGKLVPRRLIEVAPDPLQDEYMLVVERASKKVSVHLFDGSFSITASDLANHHLRMSSLTMPPVKFLTRISFL